MSGLSFSERVKMLLQKRLDTSKWPLGDSGQGPGAIRYLTDGQGNIIALLTTSINPNDPEPIGPGSAEAAAEADPIFQVQGAFNFPMTVATLKNVKLISLLAILSGTEELMTFQEGTADYSVPTGKKLILYQLDFAADAATIPFSIGSGSDGVAPGNTLPTDPINLIGNPLAIGQYSPYVTGVADTPYSAKISGQLAAGRFPFCDTIVTNARKAAQLYALEADV